MDCAIYVRVSSKDQAEDGYSLDAQERILIDYCKSKNLSYEIYEDPGISGETISKRPAMLKLLDDALDDKFQICLVTEQDRLSRSDDIIIIKKIFRENGIKIATPTQLFDLEDDEDDFISDLYGILSKRENKLRTRRVNRGKVEAAKKGKYMGGTLIYGYQPNPQTNMIEIDEDEAEVVKMIFGWSTAGVSTCKIAERLNSMGIPSKKAKTPRWTGSTITGQLHNKSYIGEHYYKGYKVAIPAIISEDLFKQAQEQLKKNKRGGNPRNTGHFYLLQGLLYCKRCNHGLYGLNYTNQTYKKEGDGRFYRCAGKIRSPFRVPKCGLKNIRAKDLENIVWEKIVEIVSDSEKLVEAIKKKRSDLFIDDVSLESQVAYFDELINDKIKQEDRILELYTRKSEIISFEQLEREMLKIKKEKDEIIVQRNKLVERLNNKVVEKQKIQSIEDYLLKIRKRINTFTLMERKEFLQALLRKILIDYDEDKRRHLIEIEGAVPIFDMEQEGGEKYDGKFKYPSASCGGTVL